MLQRAASNAYSWWLSSHIRTKQSKWLEQNLQDMEEKVHTVLKLIEEDGDSFARRAEMYYKKRPELIHFVEDSYRAYRALAERYDHISTELQNANRTIASVFPEQVQIEIDEEEEEATRSPRKLPEVPNSNIPSVPKVPSRVSSSVLSSAKKKLQRNKSTKAAATCAVPKSGLSKPEALEEIDKLQKQILAMQTEKEFLKSSYEHGLTKYREIDNQIVEMQGRVFNLQDEFGVGIVIEDGEARKLMASTALKSCEETLSQLQEKQARSAEEARVESNRIKETKEKFMILRTELHGDLNGHKIRPEKLYSGDGSMNLVEELTSSDQETGPVTQERQQLELLREKIKEHLEVGTGESLSVIEMVEKIDELVNKVISLETAVSSQTALVERLRTETNDLQAQIQNLEGEKATLIDGSDSLSNKLKDMEEKLNTVQDLNRSFENQNNNVHIHFSETRRDLGHLSEKLQTMNPDELELPDPSQTEEESVGEAELKMDFEAKKAALNPQSMNPNELDLTGPSQTEEESRGEAGSKMDFKAQEAALNPQSMNPNELEFTGKESLGEAELKMDYEARKAALNPDGGSNKVQIVEPNEKLSDRDPLQEEEGSPEEIRLQNELKELEYTVKSDSSQTADSLLDVEPKERETVEKDEPDWKQMFLNGIEDREKLLLAEYTTTLRSYKDVKKKLAEVEKRSQDSDFDTSLQLKELKSANATKDEEIKALHRKINLLLKCLDGNTNIKDLTDSEYQSTSTSMDDPSFEAETETETSATTKALRTLAIGEEDINAILIDPPAPMSAIEEKLRMHIDELLEENLDFWLKFSTAFHQIQKCETGIKDLQDEIQKLEGTSKKLDSGSAVRNSLKSEARPIYKHLREIQTEITVWIENSSLLKDELQSRFTSLCNIQEEITSALKQSAEEEEFQFTSYQAAKFQGEVLNMKQENNKVADELQAGLDHVTTLQLDLEKTLTRLDEEFEFSESRRQQNSQPEQTHSQGRHRVPLRSFIFGVKSRKQKPSIFSCMNPAMGRKYPGVTQQRL